MAPEFENKIGASKASDVYALGRTLLYLYSPNYVMCNKFNEHKSDFLKMISNKTHITLIELMLRLNPKGRHSCLEIKDILKYSKLIISRNNFIDVTLNIKNDFKVPINEYNNVDKTLFCDEDNLCKKQETIKINSIGLVLDHSDTNLKQNFDNLKLSSFFACEVELLIKLSFSTNLKINEEKYIFINFDLALRRLL
jgi:serine/threonine protein kinase